MSHIVEIAVEVRDPLSIHAACRRLRLEPPVNGRHQLFSATADGLAVRLPDWRYPVVCRCETGQLAYDNYGGRWGEQQHLDRFLQAYAVERASSQARAQGFVVLEQPLSNGAIRLDLLPGGDS